MILALATILDRLGGAIQAEYRATEALDQAVDALKKAMDDVGEAQTCLLDRPLDLKLDTAVAAMWRAYEPAQRSVKRAYARVQWLEDEHSRLERYAEWA